MRFNPGSLAPDLRTGQEKAAGPSPPVHHRFTSSFRAVTPVTTRLCLRLSELVKLSQPIPGMPSRTPVTEVTSRAWQAA